MVTIPRFLIASRSGLPLIGGTAAGVLVLGVVLALPQAMLEAGVWRSGIAALVTAAHPPLGTTARLLLAGSGAVSAGAVIWSALYLIVGPGGPLAGQRSVSARKSKPGQRRGDRHPDAPPRPPMRAADLGTPLMEVAPSPTARPPVEAHLPTNLDTPLAAFDPAALPPIPRSPVRPVAPLAPTRPALAAGERLETFALEPLIMPISPAAPLSVEALLRRLEEKAARRPPTQARA